MTNQDVARYALVGIERELQRLTAIRDHLRRVVGLHAVASKPPHWTQRPENARKLRRILRRAHRARFQKAG